MPTTPPPRPTQRERHQAKLASVDYEPSGSFTVRASARRQPADLSGREPAAGNLLGLTMIRVHLSLACAALSCAVF